MSYPAIRVENLSKQYRLGVTHAGSIRELVNRTAARWLKRAPDNRPGGKHGNTFWALRDLNFEIPVGKAIGIIGRNGAGKSTLLKLLSRITKPTAGRIELRGRVASLLEVGTGFHPELTGRENVYLNGTILGMTRAEIGRRFDEIVGFSGVEDFVDTPVKRYSSGMKVRLGFAVAAHLEPEILIVDEVLAVGDVEFQQRCLGKMDEVAGSGRTVLFVSHNMATVRQLTQSSLVLKDGQIAYLGSTDEAIDVYTAHNRDASSQRGQRPSQELGRRVKIESVSLGHQDACYGVEEAIQMALTLRSHDYDGPARISLTIYRGDRVPVGSTFSDESVCLQAGQTTSVEVALPGFKLAPGSYYFALSVGKGNPSSSLLEFDSLSDVMHFDILRPTLSEGGVAVWHRGWGAIQFPKPQVRTIDRQVSLP